MTRISRFLGHPSVWQKLAFFSIGLLIPSGLLGYLYARQSAHVVRTTER